MSFSSLGLSAPLLEALADTGYESPTPIQTKAIPPALAQRDILAAAQTGTGKTASFLLPILQRLSEGPRAQSNQVRALILTPTRELAGQVESFASTYGKNLKLRSAVVYGGVKINPQMMKLRGGIDILVATPGRLLDLHHQNAVRFTQLEVLVLDEADRMLDMGFIPDIRRILKVLPPKRQNLMFSATLSPESRALASDIVNAPVEIAISPRNTTATSIKQWMIPVDKKQKPALLAYLINDENWDQVLVFARTKQGSNKLVRFLISANISADTIHGDKSQSAREKALALFKKGKTQVLVATDLAARGLDIDQLPCVINFDLPNVAENYIHRIGRTGRAGARGNALSLVSADEFQQLSDIERLIKTLLPRTVIDGFEPDHNVPASKLDLRPIKPKKPKKPKQANQNHSKENPNHPDKPPRSKHKKSNPRSERPKQRSRKKPLARKAK